MANRTNQQSDELKAALQNAYAGRARFVDRIVAGEYGPIRKELCIDEKQYDALWFEVLEFLHSCVCKKIVDDVMYERGLNAFNLLMTSLRDHRSLIAFRKMWSYEN